MTQIDFNEFKKIELRAGKILSAEEIEGKDKIYKLNVDIGEEERTIVAGVAEYYKTEELEGKMIVVVKNLKPAKIAGIKSEGMLLAAYDDKENICVLISPEKEVKPGMQVG
ncbi:MAG: methionine--tRNA ligase subunit beta [Candidatus Undinarchaeales archaeon]